MVSPFDAAEPGPLGVPIPAVETPVGGTWQLWPVAATFATFGVFFGSWEVVSPELIDALGGGPGRFGLVMSGGLALGALGNAVGGALTERRGTATALSWTLWVWAALLALGSVAPAPWGLAALMMTVIAVTGTVDVAANVAATVALADQPGRLVRFHAIYNLGGVLGCLLAGVAVGRIGPDGWRWLWPLMAIAAVVLALGGRGARLPAADGGEHARLADGLRALRTERLIGPAIGFALGAMVEASVGTWGVLHLRRQLDAGLLVGAGGAMLGFGVAAAARVTVGGMRSPAAARAVLAAGSVAATVGIAVLASVDQPIVAAGGLVLGAAGVAVVWPLLMAEVGRGRERPAVLIGATSTVGYIGLVSGPAVVGAIATRWGTGIGLWVVAVAAAGIAPAALAGRPLAGVGAPVDPTAAS